jgi:predicted outer membrane repeat protein
LAFFEFFKVVDFKNFNFYNNTAVKSGGAVYFDNFPEQNQDN